jgi:hypothetical protein
MKKNLTLPECIVACLCLCLIAFVYYSGSCGRLSEKVEPVDVVVTSDCNGTYDHELNGRTAVQSEPKQVETPDPTYVDFAPIIDMCQLVDEYTCDSPQNLFDMWTRPQQLILHDLGLNGYLPWEEALTAFSEDPTNEEARMYIEETLQLAYNYYEGLEEGELYLAPEHLPIHAYAPLD